MQVQFETFYARYKRAQILEATKASELVESSPGRMHLEVPDPFISEEASDELKS